MRPARLLRGYNRENLRPDLMAGITVGVVALPQGIAFALLAGLPAEMGVYASVVAAVVAALWGSSNQLSTGPTNSSSLLVFSILAPLALTRPEYIAAAGLLAVMAGLFRVVMGLAGLGVLVNFVSDAVIVGFTSGAGVLIIVSQLRVILGLTFPSSPRLVDTLRNVAISLPDTHVITLALCVVTIAVTLAIKRTRRSLPGPLIGMGVAALLVWALDLPQLGVDVLDELPRGLPPLADLPLLNIDLIGDLSTGALAVAVIGLVEAVAIARSIATQTRQRLDSNQEFIGQGLANIAAGLFSGYPCSGSFNRSSLNFESGARSPLAGVFSGLAVLVVVFLFAPLAVHVPLAAIAATLILSAYAMIDRREMMRIWASTRGDRLIMVATIVATLLLPLQFAVLIGVMMSLAYYIWRTSLPRVFSVVPDAHFKHLVHQLQEQGAALPACPQLGILEIQGDLYFGAVQNIEDAMQLNLQRNPDQRFLLLRMLSVAQIDISGIHMLEHVVHTYRQRKGDLFLVRVQRPVFQFMQSTGFVDMLGKDHFLHEDAAISHLFHHTLDPAICIYECERRVFLECQNLPKQTLAQPLELSSDLPAGLRFPMVPPRLLWEQLHSAAPPAVYDVREPREFQRAHIPGAQSLPLPQVLQQRIDLPRGQKVVLACRTGRRSERAAQSLLTQGFDNIQILEGGLTAWEAAGLLEAVDLSISEGA